HHRHRIGELMLDPHLNDERLARFVTPENMEVWTDLSAAVPPLARPRCQEMALWCGAATTATR
ncbi:MAG: hypothetical protein ABF306_19800, partial [Nocardioides marinisabuli]|uniref:hypothetical protein n=1 Tax=Nocardioides marinisabuli TaxID=419476 RepID=UPI00321BDE82